MARFEDDTSGGIHNRIRPDNERRRMRQIHPPSDSNFNKHEETQQYRKFNHNISVDNRWNRFSGNRQPQGDQMARSSSNRSFYHTRNPRTIDYSKKMNFKEFVSNQDDRITPEQAVAKYEEYGREFTRKQTPMLFEKYRKYEWFLVKYHPYYEVVAQISLIRKIRERTVVFHHLLSHGLFHKVSLNNDCQLIIPLIDIVNHFLDGQTSNDAIDRFLQLCNSRQNIIEDELKPLKRKHMDIEMDEDEDHEINCNTFENLRNISIHVENIPLDMKHKKLVRSLKDVRDFSRIAILAPEKLIDETCKAIITFSPGSDSKLALENIKDIDGFKDKIEASVCYSTCPVIKTIKGPWFCYNAVLSHLRTLIDIIQKLDSHLMVYSDELPLLPNYNRELESEYLQDEILKGDSDSESITSESEQTSSHLPSITKNEVIEKSKEIMDQFPTHSSSNQIPSQMVELLDTLILYLRIVHSIDFYSSTYYRQEHEMSSRVSGIGIRKSSLNLTYTDSQVQEEVISHEGRVTNLINRLLKQERVHEEIGELKIEADEIEKYLNQKTNEIRENSVYQCRICDKKFQGKEFVFKHIHNKHPGNIEFVKFNTLFYNNFITDTKSTSNILTSSSQLNDTTNISRTSIGGSETTQKRRILPKYNNLNEPDVQAFNF